MHTSESRNRATGTGSLVSKAGYQMQRFNDAFDKGIIIVPALAFLACVMMYIDRLLAIVIAGVVVAIVIGTMAYAAGLLIRHLNK